MHEKTPAWLEKEVVSLRDRNSVLSDAVSKLEAEVKELRQFKFESTKTLTRYSHERKALRENYSLDP